MASQLEMRNQSGESEINVEPHSNFDVYTKYIMGMKIVSETTFEPILVEKQPAVVDGL
jgi:hypothetical protein